MFNNEHYVTFGVHESVPSLLQAIIWELIKNMPVDKDYLQVFYLSEEKGRQRIKHSQEVPEYSKEYIFNTGMPITEKIYVIDDTTHSTMLLANEY